MIHIRRQDFVSVGCGTIVNDRNNWDSDIFFNHFEDRFAHQSGAAEDGIDVYEKRQVGIVSQQTENF